MVLGNYALQRGWHPAQLTDWFHRSFVDGYDWVMVPTSSACRQYADGGVMTTKPYAAGGAYIDRMSDYCGGCRYDPDSASGEDACPYTAGYWAFLRPHRRAAGRQPRHGAAAARPRPARTTSTRSSRRSGHADRPAIAAAPPCRRSLRVRFGSRSAPARADRAERPPRGLVDVADGERDEQQDADRRGEAGGDHDVQAGAAQPEEVANPMVTMAPTISASHSTPGTPWST